MDWVTGIINSVSEALGTLWVAFVNFLPSLIGAILVFVILWFVAVVLGAVVAKIIRSFKVDAVLEKLGFRAPLERAGLNLDSGKFIGELVKWFVIIVALMAASEIVKLNTIKDSLGKILNYLPDVIIASLILIIGALVANFLQKLVKASIDAGGVGFSSFMGSLAKWSILVFTFIAALKQLRIAESVLDAVTFGLVGMLAIAGGLAFGLGGQSNAKAFLDKLKSEFFD